MSRYQLHSFDDFLWYKRAADKSPTGPHPHWGTPVMYPCAVQTQFIRDGETLAGLPDPPMYWHTFFYPIKGQCLHCGHVGWVWAVDGREDAEPATEDTRTYEEPTL